MSVEWMNLFKPEESTKVLQKKKQPGCDSKEQVVSRNQNHFVYNSDDYNKF